RCAQPGSDRRLRLPRRRLERPRHRRHSLDGPWGRSRPGRRSLNEHPLDLKESIRAIWWRRRLVATLAGIGLVGGLGFSVIRPPMPSAEALVLLPPRSEE